MALTLSSTQGLMRPSFGNVEQLGQDIGSLAAKRRQRGMLTDLLEPLTDPMASSADLAAASRSLLSVDPRIALQVAGTARQRALAEQQERQKPKNRLEYFERKPEELAGLYEKFNPESVNSFLTGTGPLVPLEKEAASSASSFGKQLNDAGFKTGSEEYNRLLREHIEGVISGRNKGVSYKPPLEQAAFLNEALTNSPYRAKTNGIVQLANDAHTIRDRVEAGESEAVNILQRITSMLFDADTRAASEIDRLVEGKGIARSVADAFEKFSGSAATPESRGRLLGIVEAMEELAQRYNTDAVQGVVDLYGDFVDKSVLNQFRSVNKELKFYKTVDAVSSESKEDPEPIPALPDDFEMDR
jgi:hypothetical protein